jgi:tRNA pseudouridine55 synthase
MKRRIDGVLLLDKGAGMTSNAVLQAAKRLYRAAKAGHTGTLDPAATGLLPLCFGEATKFAQYLLDTDKTYEGVMRLGIRTATGDSEGKIIEKRPVSADEAVLRGILPRFVGEISQVPPMHSAIKHAGRPLYRYARQGVEVARPARMVAIHELTAELLAPDRVVFRARVSKGTYIRVLAEEIGQAMGCGAHLLSLRRTAMGRFDISKALPLEDIEAMDDGQRLAALLPTDSLLAEKPRIGCDAEESRQLRHGQAIWRAHTRPGECYRIYDAEGALIGVGTVNMDGKLAPKRLMAGRMDTEGCDKAICLKSLSSGGLK